MENEKDSKLFEQWSLKLNQLFSKSDITSKELMNELKNTILKQRGMMEKFFKTIHE